MAGKKVCSFDYYDPEQGVRVMGSGMCTRDAIREMREKSPEKDHQAIESSEVEVDESQLTATGRFHPPNQA